MKVEGSCCELAVHGQMAIMVSNYESFWLTGTAPHNPLAVGHLYSCSINKLGLLCNAYELYDLCTAFVCRERFNKQYCLQVVIRGKNQPDGSQQHGTMYCCEAMSDEM